MSSVDAANTQTITIVDEPTPGPPTPPPPDSPSAHDPRQADALSSVDGRTSDAEKMLQSTAVPMTEGDPGADAAGPSNLDASQQPPMDTNGAGADESQPWAEDEAHELKRVKVYELIGSRWVDQGTAFCFGDCNENQALLIARAEADYNHIILSTKIRPTDVYQRQQDTLIVWTEPTGVDFALSFQDPEGCEEVWNYIQEVQRHMTIQEAGLSSSPIINPEPPMPPATTAILRSGILPPPTLTLVPDIERAIKVVARTPPMKERLCEFIQAEDYIKALVELFAQAEDLESIESLHALCTCMQTILMLNDHSMYEHILDDDIFFGVVGMLEYDPEFPTHKANYREFLRQTSHFHQPIPIRDETIQRKIHHTYRLQFLKDVVLARALDDSTFNVLNSCILFNQIDIINHIQSDGPFLRDVVGTFLDEEMMVRFGFAIRGPEMPKVIEEKNKMEVDPPEVKATNGVSSSSSLTNGVYKPVLSESELKRRREIVSLLQQLCVMGKNVQLPARMALFHALADRGVLFAVQWALSQPENEPEGLQMISAGGEILASILDHDILTVRNQVIKVFHIMAELENEKSAGKRPQMEPIVLMMCRVMTRSRNLAVQSLIAEALRVMLEVPQGDAADPHSAMGAKMYQRPKDDPTTERFLEFFYKQCAEILFGPLIDLPEFKTQGEGTLSTSRERTNLYLHLCELLASFALQHSFRSHFYMLSSNIANHVGTLLTARDKHLRLAAFRFFRVLLRLNNRNLFSHLMKNDAFKPILDLTIRESRRDNLLSSTCKEFFEYMRKENMKELIHHCMTKHQDKIKSLTDRALTHDCFVAFTARWEMNMEPPPKEEMKDKLGLVGVPKRWSQTTRPNDALEDEYFNADDDDDTSKQLSQVTPPFKRRRTRGQGVLIRPAQQRSPVQRTPTLGSLVDYEDPEDNSAESDEHPASAVFTMSGRSPGSPSPQQQVASLPRMQNRPLQLKAASSLLDVPGQVLSPAALEELSSSLFAQTAESSPPKATSGPPELAPTLKRQRDEDDEDELLEQLVSGKVKRLSGQSSPTLAKEESQAKSASPSPAIKPITIKTEDTPSPSGPRKIRLKLPSALPAASPTVPTVSSTGVKDGDTG